MYDGDTFTIPQAPGYTFQLKIVYDDDNTPPWERADGHGKVRSVSAWFARPKKSPGERVLFSERGTHWIYDWQDACKQARRDGWNAEPFDAPNRIERAVQADFDYLRRYLENQWHYVGVCVSLLDEDGGRVTDPYEFAIWGIESEATDYIEEVAKELARECAMSRGITLDQRRKAWRDALTEARERRYWMARGVATA